MSSPSYLVIVQLWRTTRQHLKDAPGISLGASFRHSRYITRYIYACAAFAMSAERGIPRARALRSSLPARTWGGCVDAHRGHIDTRSDVRLGNPRGFLHFRAYPFDDSHATAAHGFQRGFARDMPISNSKFESGRTCLPLG